MLAILKYLWAALNSGAPKDESGCSRGGRCRHQDNCPRLNCAGHPSNNIGRSEDEGTPVTWRDVPGLYAFLAACALAWVAFLAWLIFG